MRRLTVLGAVIAVLLGVVLSGFTGCGEEGNFIGNRRPYVELTATPPGSVEPADTTEPGISRYDVEFHWNGWDDDGEVTYFEYFIDPPVPFPDTGWTQIEAYSSRFTFTALEYDTTTIDDPQDWKRPQIALGYHVFVIRAVDDMGAVSDPDYVAFNAATIAPRTYITSPPPFGPYNGWQGSGQKVGLRVTFRWEGEDLDGIFTDKPVSYIFKVTDVTANPPVWVPGWQAVIDSIWRDPSPWIETEEGQTQMTVSLDNGHAYGVAVRAIDEASAVEPLIVLNRNMLWVAATELSSFPNLWVESAAFGRRKWSGWTQDTETYEVPKGSIYQFTLSADASWYGGLIAGFSYGWDLENLETTETDPDGIGAWTPWSTTRTVITAEFKEPRDYFLYVKCKDDGGGLTLATIHFSVITLKPTKYLAYIDDWKHYYDEISEDRVWRAMLDGYNRDLEGNLIPWDDCSFDVSEARFGQEIPTLRFLSQFKTLVWSINDNRMLGANQKSAWYRMNYLDAMNVIAVYLGSETEGGEKGKLWAFGRGVVESSVLPYGSQGGACEYPYAVMADARHDGCKIRRRSFAFDYLHIIGDFLSSDPEESGGARVNLYGNFNDRPLWVYVDTAGVPVEGYTRKPARELYPELLPKLELNTDSRRANWAVFEVLEYPNPNQEKQLLFCDPWFEQMTNLEPLYRYHARTTASKNHRKFCGFRYQPAGQFDHGEVVYFFFPMFPFDDDQIRHTAKAVLSGWFGLPDPDALPEVAEPAVR